MNYNRYFPGLDMYSWNECEIGKIYFHSWCKFYFLKISRYGYFDLTNNYLSRVNPKYLSDNKIYLKADAAYLSQFQKPIKYSEVLKIVRGKEEVQDND